MNVYLENFFFSLYSSLASLKSWVRPCQQQITPNSKFCIRPRYQ